MLYPPLATGEDKFGGHGYIWIIGRPICNFHKGIECLLPMGDQVLEAAGPDLSLGEGCEIIACDDTKVTTTSLQRFPQSRVRGSICINNVP